MAKSTEENNDYFVIEQSLSGQVWDSIGYVGGNGSSLKPINYRYDVKNPPNSQVFYRLKQVDFDGKTDYSKTCFIEGIQGPEIIYFNNRIAVYGVEGFELNSHLNASIFSISGKMIVSHLKWNLEDDGSASFLLQNLPSGVYIFRIQNYTLKFIKP